MEFDPEKERKNMIMSGCCGLIISAVFIGVTFGLLAENKDAGENCCEDMILWLQVYGGGCHGLAAFIFLLNLIIGIGKISL